MSAKVTSTIRTSTWWRLAAEKSRYFVEGWPAGFAGALSFAGVSVEPPNGLQPKDVAIKPAPSAK